MHFSAERGLAIACRLSVCLSVCDVGDLFMICDHIGRKSWQLIAQTVSPTPLSSQPKGDSPTPRGTWGNFWGD